MSQSPRTRLLFGATARLAARAPALKVVLCSAAATLGLLLIVGLFVASAPGAGGGRQLCTLAGASGQPIPANYLPWLQRAASRYSLGPRGISIVAAIHKVESDFGRSDLPGVRSGTNSAGAAGPTALDRPHHRGDESREERDDEHELEHVSRVGRHARTHTWPGLLWGP